MSDVHELYWAFFPPMVQHRLFTSTYAYQVALQDKYYNYTNTLKN